MQTICPAGAAGRIKPPSTIVNHSSSTLTVPQWMRTVMTIPMSKGVRAPVEQLYRPVIKNFLLNDAPLIAETLPRGRLGAERVLPPYFGEMGFEIRYHLAQIEPWLRHGWETRARKPAFYPEGTAIAAPEFFAAADHILKVYGVIGSHGGVG